MPAAGYGAKPAMQCTNGFFELNTDLKLIVYVVVIWRSDDILRERVVNLWAKFDQNSVFLRVGLGSIYRVGQKVDQKVGPQTHDHSSVKLEPI